MISFPRELSDEMAEEIATRARVCGGGAFDFWEALCEKFGQARRKLWIEGIGSDLFGAWLTAEDGDIFQVGPLEPNPFAIADWCEKNGFDWEVIGLLPEYDPHECLAKWRAEQ